MRPVLLYSVLRLGLFLLVWAALLFAGMHYLLAGAVAALIAMLLSILLLRGPREGAAQRWQEADEARRERRAGTAADEDAEEEDALLDEGGAAQTPEQDGAPDRDDAPADPQGAPAPRLSEHEA